MKCKAAYMLYREVDELRREFRRLHEKSTRSMWNTTLHKHNIKIRDLTEEITLKTVAAGVLENAHDDGLCDCVERIRMIPEVPKIGPE